MIKLLCLLLLLPNMLPEAEPITETAELTGIYEAEESLTEEERQISGNLTLDGSYDAGGALGRLWSWIHREIKEQLRRELGFFGGLIGIALLCGLAANLCADQKTPRMTELAACCAGVLMLTGNVEGVIQQTVEALNRIADYSRAVLPGYFTVCAVSGAPTSASVKDAASIFVLDGMISLSQRLILPLILAYLGLSVCAGLFDNSLLSAAGRLTKWCAVTAMTLMTTGFGLYVSLTGLIAGSTDQLAVKTTKTVIASSLPVVGGILSDSAASLLAAAALIKNSAGVFCLIAVCVLCAGPLVILGVKLFLFKAASAAAELVCGGRYSVLLSRVGTVFAMMLGLLGSYCMMLFLSVMSGIRMVSP